MHWAYWLRNQSPLSAPLPVAPPAMEGEGVWGEGEGGGGGCDGAVGHRDSKSSSSRSKCTHSCREEHPGTIEPLPSVARHTLNVQYRSKSGKHVIGCTPVPLFLDNKNMGWQVGGTGMKRSPHTGDGLRIEIFLSLKCAPGLKWQGRLKWKAHTFHATVHVRTHGEPMEPS